VDASLLTDLEKKVISPGYEEELIHILNQYLKSFKRYQIELPAWVCLSLIGVKGYIMWTEDVRWGKKGSCIDRDELIVTPIRIESYDSPADKILKSAFDSIWNACGYKKSFNYDENGNWNRGS
jgi:hypothetical protein